MAAVVEIVAAMCGLLGTLLLATRGRRAGWGFVAFLASNAGWLVFSATHGHWFMFWQQIGFSISSLIGIGTWLVLPAVRARKACFLGCRHYVPEGEP